MDNKEAMIAVDLTPREAAKAIKVSEQTLAHWRVRGEGPPYRKLGAGRSAPIRYPSDLFEAWRLAWMCKGEAA